MSTLIERLTSTLADRYLVERELGQGGMATVFLATDVRHQRKVAVKVLRAELAAVIGAERFLAEIKTTAGLQHPHILPLHDSGEADGTVFYVMPFVEGQSLRDRLNHERQLSIEDAVRITREVASALDYAHRNNVVHRDIKPENILLLDGQALVADFGIALAVSRTDTASRMTETGMSLGTPHYMAPEQAMGEREISSRADIYALGAMLYEMLTGEPPFTGATAQAIVARAVTERPRPISLQRHTVPAHIEAAVFVALEKVPADRFPTAGEFSAALANATFMRGISAGSAGNMDGRSSKRARLVVPLAAIALMSLVALAWALLRPAPDAPVSRYAIEFPEAQAPDPARTFLLSDDGSQLLFVGPAVSPNVQLWIKARDKEIATPIAGTLNAQRAAFSPDAQSVAFVVPGLQLKRTSIRSNTSVTLADNAALSRGLAWMDDGSIAFLSAAPKLGRELRIVSDAGGKSTIVWQSDSTSAWTPEALPGSKGLLFMRCPIGSGCVDGRDLMILDLKTLKTTLVVSGVVGAKYVSTGHIVYVRRDGGMLAQPFDAKALKVTGMAVPVQDSVALGTNDLPLFTIAGNGMLIMRQGASLSSSERHELVWVDRKGLETAIDSTFLFHLTNQGGNRGWSLSPDGKRVAIGLNTDAGDNVWLKQLPAGPLSRLTFDTVPQHRPRWSPDGKFVLFVKMRSTTSGEIFKRASDLTGSDIPLVTHQKVSLFESQYSNDGKWLVVRTGGSANVVGGRDIMVVATTGDTTLQPLVSSVQFDEAALALSPDNRWIAYESNETGQTEVYVRPFPNASAGKVQVSNDGGRAPLWSRNGKELFYVNAAREMIAVPVGANASLQLGERTRLFKMRSELYLAPLDRYTPFDISLDGQRFLMARRVDIKQGKIPPLSVTENWFVELRQRMAKR